LTVTSEYRLWTNDESTITNYAVANVGIIKK